MPTSDQTGTAALITRSIWPVSSFVSSSCFSSVISQGISHTVNNIDLVTGVRISPGLCFILISRLILNCAEFILTKFIFQTECFFPPAWFLCLTRWEKTQRLLIMLTPSLLILVLVCFSFMHWLLIVNSSSNFIIYLFMGQKFKQVLKEKLRR